MFFQPDVIEPGKGDLDVSFNSADDASNDQKDMSRLGKSQQFNVRFTFEVTGSKRCRILFFLLTSGDREISASCLRSASLVR